MRATATFSSSSSRPSGEVPGEPGRLAAFDVPREPGIRGRERLRSKWGYANHCSEVGGHADLHQRRNLSVGPLSKSEWPAVGGLLHRTSANEPFTLKMYGQSWTVGVALSRSTCPAVSWRIPAIVTTR